MPLTIDFSSEMECLLIFNASHASTVEINTRADRVVKGTQTDRQTTVMLLRKHRCMVNERSGEPSQNSWARRKLYLRITCYEYHFSSHLCIPVACYAYD